MNGTSAAGEAGVTPSRSVWEPGERVTSWLARHPAVRRLSPWLIDAAIAIGLGLIGMAQLPTRHAEGTRLVAPAIGAARPFPSTEGVALAVALLWLAVVPLVFRSRWPAASLVGTVVFAAPFLAVSNRQLAILPIVLVGLYTVVAHSKLARVQAWGVALAAVAALATAILAGGHHAPDWFWGMGGAMAAAAILLGDSMRSRREVALAAERRAIDAEQTREAHAARRVSDERLQIARELHDIVAHNLALINVQAGVAAHLRQSDPAQVQEAFENIRRVSHTTLDEMRALVGVLRTPLAGDGDAAGVPRSASGAAMRPTAGLAGLDPLVASVRRSGVEVALTVEGERRHIAATVDVSAFRILQEALTNAVRHGGGAPIAVRVVFGVDALRLEVTNPVRGVPDPAGSLGGHGVAGMRERAAALGGTLFAGPRGDGAWVVEATLPRAHEERDGDGGGDGAGAT